MQIAPQVVVALLLASRIVLSEGTVVDGTETATSTVTSSTETSTVSTSTSTASSSTTGTMTETHSITASSSTTTTVTTETRSSTATSSTETSATVITETHSITASSNTATTVTTGTRSSTATSSTETSGTVITETHSISATSHGETSGTVTTETHSITTASNTDSSSTVTSTTSTSISTTTLVIGQTSTETSSGTRTPNTETSTSTWVITVLCLGDAETFDAGFGNCSTYSPDIDLSEFVSNYDFCDLDEDRDGLLARQVCPECGLCTVGTSTTSAHTTTGTSSETSTTSPHTTTDTSSTTTPHTTTETDTTTHTRSPCDRAFETLWLALSREGDAACELVNDTCPAACAAAPLEQTIVACGGNHRAYGAEAGFLATEVLRYAEGACQEVVVDAVLGSTAYELSCFDRLALLHAPIHACSGDDNASACPEVCERVMDSAFGRCSPTDTFQLRNVNYTAAELVGPPGPFEWSPQCLAVLGTKTFLGAGATSTDEPASTTSHHVTGSVGSSSMATSSSGTTTGESSGVTSSSVADEEEPSSFSHQSRAGLRVLLLAGLFALI